MLENLGALLYVITMLLKALLHKIKVKYPKVKDIFDRLEFEKTIWSNKLYFGPVMGAKMGRVVRHGYMQKLVELECKRLKSFVAEAPQDDFQYRVLEIGSWAGGSTITFAEGIKKYNNSKGFVVCIDPWRSFHQEHVEKKSHAVMERALETGEIFNLFLHNIKFSGLDNLVIPIKGCSRDVLPILKERAFNLIFIDGSHFYKDVIKDLEMSGELLAEGGILCGDDLELQVHELDKSGVESYRDNDSATDQKTKIAYHPGVTLAVAEFFGKPVSAWKGFWAMRKVSGSDASVGVKWEKVFYEDLDRGNVSTPKHLI